MTYRTISLPPGMVTNATPYATANSWWQLGQMRFVGNALQPIGGWNAVASSNAGIIKLNDVVRGIFTWRDNTRLAWLVTSSLGQIILFNGGQSQDITPASFVAGTPGSQMNGYGLGRYQDGVSLYGRAPVIPPSSAPFIPIIDMGDAIKFDNWGEQLVFVSSADGRVFYVQPDADVAQCVATPVPNAPGGVTSLCVTNERSLLLLGINGDPRAIGWCSLEDFTDWNFSGLTNTAGTLQLVTQGGARNAYRVREGTLIFCDDDVHLLQYVGPPFTYGLTRVGDRCGPLGPQAIARSTSITAWVGKSNFWQWQGGPQPISCPVADRVFGNMNKTTAARSCAWINGLFAEFWFWFPSTESVEPDTAVVWNYTRDLWWIFPMSRTAAFGADAWQHPLAGDVSGYTYEHETGFLDNGNSRIGEVFAETSALNFAPMSMYTGTQQRSLITQLIPDLINPQNVEFTFFTQDGGSADPEITYGPYSVITDTGFVDCFLEGRDIRLRVSGTFDGLWKLGDMRLDVSPGSQF